MSLNRLKLVVKSPEIRFGFGVIAIALIAQVIFVIKLDLNAFDMAVIGITDIGIGLGVSFIEVGAFRVVESDRRGPNGRFRKVA